MTYDETFPPYKPRRPQSPFSVIIAVAVTGLIYLAAGTAILVWISSWRTAGDRSSVWPTSQASLVSTDSTPASRSTERVIKENRVETDYQQAYVIEMLSTKEQTYGKTDLIARILEVGYLDSSMNKFSNTDDGGESTMRAVRFEIENTGTADTPPWTFSAVLPTFPMRIYESEEYGVLSPGERATFTLGFENAVSDVGGVITINADPTNVFSEIDETNNLATSSIVADVIVPM